MSETAEEPKSIIELGLEYGLTDEQIEEQLVTSVAVYGLMILEEEYNNDGEGMAFPLVDDIGDIEVVVRRVQPGGAHANTVSSTRVLH